MPQNNVKVSYLTVTANEDGQRLDNYLMARLKGVPRSRVYRIIRSGEVRVNKGRAKPSARVHTGDEIRVPPIRMQEAGPAQIPEHAMQQIRESVLQHENHILVLNKPAGLAVHAGSGLSYGLIDVARAVWGEQWQLVHRLDRETSGVLLLVSRRELQHEFQQAQADGAIEKDYLALVHGQWPVMLQRLESRLGRSEDASGQRRVGSANEGQLAISEFELDRSLRASSLLNVRIHTGRTHQIRVQAAEAGHPLVGDSKYGRRELDKQLQLSKRPGLCLHAQRLQLSMAGKSQCWTCTPPQSFSRVVDELEAHYPDTHSAV